MSNQLVITSGAKVRNLSGVLTGTAGVVSSVPYGGANGVATLDSSGKVPLSQLPASVITYLGTWNASTNTPTLVNGTGDTGDLYICNVAGTVNFGAGPITFAVGDWVIYSGTTWEKSGGASGTVTSVAMTTPTGLSVTGSPITTSGTLALSLSSGYTIPTTSFLSGLVPYTGATANVDLGVYYLTTARLNSNEIKATTSGGIDIHSNSGTQVALFGAGGGAGTTFYGGINGTTANFSGQLTLGSTITNGTNTYTLPSATGTLALTSDIPSLTGYVPYTGATATLDLGLFPLQSFGVNIAGGSGLGGAVNIRQATSHSLWTGGNYTSIFADTSYGLKFYFANDARTFTLSASAISAGSPPTYTMPASSGTLALTSDIPSLTNYVTLNTLQTITGVKFFNAEASFDSNIVLTGGDFVIGNSGYDTSINTETLTASRSINFPNKSGVVAMTSDIPSLSGYVQGSGTTSYHAKFTGSGTIGNSMLTDDGTTLQSIGATRSNLYLKAASSSYYSQLAFTNGTNGSFGGISYNNSGQYMQFETNSSEWMRLTSDGNLGLGTTSPIQTSGYGFMTTNGSSGSGYITKVNGTTSMYLYSNASDSRVAEQRNLPLVFETNGTQRMRITADGHVGIDIVPSNWQYSVVGGILQVGNSSMYEYGNYEVGLQVNAYYNGGWKYIASGSTTSTQIQLNDGNILFNNAPAGTAGNTINYVERMRIRSDGNVGIGNTGDANYRLIVTGVDSGSSNWTLMTINAAGTAMFRVRNDGLFMTGTASLSPINNTTSSAANANIGAAGDLRLSTASSQRFKDNIQDWNGNGLETILALKPRTFNYKADYYKHPEVEMLGLIAEEVAEVSPYLADFENEDRTGQVENVRYANIVVPLIKAIQELSAKVSALENKS